MNEAGMFLMQQASSPAEMLDKPLGKWDLMFHGGGASCSFRGTSGPVAILQRFGAFASMA